MTPLTPTNIHELRLRSHITEDELREFFGEMLIEVKRTDRPDCVYS